MTNQIVVLVWLESGVYSISAFFKMLVNSIRAIPNFFLNLSRAEHCFIPHQDIDSLHSRHSLFIHLHILSVFVCIIIILVHSRKRDTERAPAFRGQLMWPGMSYLVHTTCDNLSGSVISILFLNNVFLLFFAIVGWENGYNQVHV